MTIFEAIKTATEEAPYGAHLARTPWHPRRSLYIETAGWGDEYNHIFAHYVLDENGSEEFSMWTPTVRDMLADDWLIRSLEPL